MSWSTGLDLQGLIFSIHEQSHLSLGGSALPEAGPLILPWHRACDVCLYLCPSLP